MECNGPDVLGSYDELYSAFGNLASNAVRYTPAGGTITLRWQDGPAGPQFIAQDTGIGISQNIFSRLTERFLPRRQEPFARNPGHGPGPGHRQARAAAPWRYPAIQSVADKGSSFYCQHAKSSHAAAGRAAGQVGRGAWPPMFPARLVQGWHKSLQSGHDFNQRLFSPRRRAATAQSLQAARQDTLSLFATVMLLPAWTWWPACRAIRGSRRPSGNSRRSPGLPSGSSCAKPLPATRPTPFITPC